MGGDFAEEIIKMRDHLHGGYVGEADVRVIDGLGVVMVENFKNLLFKTSVRVNSFLKETKKVSVLSEKFGCLSSR